MRMLEVGHKYKDRNGDTWVCYRVDMGKPKHAQADCVRQSDGITEYFYLDGRYDGGGTRGQTIVEEVDPPDLKRGLNELRDEALRIAVEHGFKDATVAEDIALMHSELSEMLEDYREGYATDKLQYAIPGNTILRSDDPRGDNPKPVGIPSEIADVIIRALHFCGKHVIDIDKAVRVKMAYNASRPHMHGKKL